MKYIVVATDDEYKLAEATFKNVPIIKTGVGGVNVIQALKRVNKNSKIINFGYAGSNKIPIGTRGTISCCKLYHPNVDYEEPLFRLKGEYPCFTSDDFVLKTDITYPCVFDMELAYILALGFRKVESIKIISDNLSLNQYEEVVK